MPTVRRRPLPRARHLVPTSLATLACAIVGARATAVSVDSAWYESLRKPSFQPPRAAFPLAWTALYTDIAVVTAKALDELEPKERHRLVIALAANLGLNAAWCWTFFARREISLAVPVAAALAVSSTDLARRAGRARPALGLALAPYAGWTTFATALSWAIAVLNLEEQPVAARR